MRTVTATHLKNRLGEMLDHASWGPVAVERHGRVVAYLVPAKPAVERRTPHGAGRPRVHWSRAQEERVLALCASRDYRPSRWSRAGNRDFLAGLAAMLASLPEFDRGRMLSLAESLSPGATKPEAFARWLEATPLQPARFLPMLRERMAHEGARA